MKALLSFILYLLSFALVLGFVFAGHWRATAANPQVQVPTFYDAHYLFQRPWTQAQAAPGVPSAAPLALYGDNRISQPIGGDLQNISLLELDVQGDQTFLYASLTDGRGAIYRAEIELSPGLGNQLVRLALPNERSGDTPPYLLTLHAPNATYENPVLLFAVGGDRMGGSIFLNEYQRPGNLVVRTYTNGSLVGWWQALREQALPEVFQLRLQQYKPDIFKGPFFGILASVLILLSLLFLVLAQPGLVFRPSRSLLTSQLGWGLFGMVMIFSSWQLASGRLLLQPDAIPFAQADAFLALAPLPDSETPRVVHDLAQSLWTAEREPDERLFDTAALSGHSAITLPPQGELRFPLLIPPQATFKGGVVSNKGNGRYSVWLGDAQIYEIETSEKSWFEVDLSPWAGQAQTLILRNESVESFGAVAAPHYWLQPQIETAAGWLRPFANETAALARFSPPQGAGAVELVEAVLDKKSYAAGETAALSLHWHAAERTNAYPTIFVHLLDDQGEIVAQNDAPPLGGSYPVANFQPDAIVVDSHLLPLPLDLPAGEYQIAIGFYNPDDFVRWTAVAAEGAAVVDKRLTLDLTMKVTSD